MVRKTATIFIYKGVGFVLSKNKRLKLLYIINVVALVLCLLDIFKVKSLLGDTYLINDSSFISFFSNVPLLNDVFKVITDTFGTSYFVYACLSVFTMDIVYWCVCCLPFVLIDVVKGLISRE